MTCTPVLYINTDVDVLLTIDSGFTVTDIVDMTVVLTEKADATNTVTYTKSGGGVTVVGSVITLLILNPDITVAGVYDISIRITDLVGKTRGITPCPDELRFYP
jgi:hypothetical protein